MPRWPRALAAVGLLLLALPRTAAAEWHFTPMVGLTFKAATSLLDYELATRNRHWNFGGAVSWLGEGVLGLEAIAVSTPGFFKGGEFELVESSRSFALMGNIVLTTPRNWTEYSLRPYVSGGYGLLHAAAQDISNVQPVDANLKGLNVGVGAVGFFSRRTGVRFDLRYYSTLSRTDLGPMSIGPAYLSYLTASVGVVIRR